MYTSKQLMCINKPVKCHIFVSALQFNLEVESKHDSTSKHISGRKCCLYYKLSNCTLLHEHIRLWDNTTGWLSTMCVSAVQYVHYFLKLCIHSTYKFRIWPFNMRNNWWQIQSQHTTLYFCADSCESAVGYNLTQLQRCKPFIVKAPIFKSIQTKPQTRYFQELTLIK